VPQRVTRPGTALAVIAVASLVCLVAWTIAGGASGRSATIPGGDAGPLGALAPWPRSIPRPRAVLRQPIDPRQQTVLQFGERSHWLQPWRAYLDTVPAARLLSGLGVNFNVPPSEADAAARLLASAGIRRARVELPWSAFQYAHPNRLRDPLGLRRVFGALARHRIRPLVLLNANQTAPCPTRFFSAQLISPAPAGARSVQLDRATAGIVVPGRSGLNSVDGKAADTLFTSVSSDGVARLSKPLAQPLGAGSHPAATLLYAPFEMPQRADGTPDPAFEATLQGWLAYVRQATDEVRRFVGSTRFDIEVWNELTFGSDFLYADTYYDPPSQPGRGDVTAAILDRTVRLVRTGDPAMASVGIVDGFASGRPWDSGATVPAGVTAIAKHPYFDPRRFPESAQINGVMPVDAEGGSDGLAQPGGRWRDRFIPRYTAFFPEYFLTAIQTEHVIRDLSPFTTDIYGTLHGRRTHPVGSPPPQLWVTEWNLDPGVVRTPPPTAPLTALERRLQSKAILRAVLAYVNKGAGAFYLFTAQDGRLGLIPNSFFRAAMRSGRYPGDRAGGLTMDTIRRLTSLLHGSAPLAHPRRLRLLAIGDYARRTQFAGDGTPQHPPLYDRDVVAFFPFQVGDRRFVVATYVMTRDVARNLRPERYAFAIGGLPGCRVKVAATDPLTGRREAVQRISCSPRRLVVTLPLTDSPKLLTIDASSG
jgi:hypothetical protein